MDHWCVSAKFQSIFRQADAKTFIKVFLQQQGHAYMATSSIEKTQ